MNPVNESPQVSTLPFLPSARLCPLYLILCGSHPGIQFQQQVQWEAFTNQGASDLSSFFTWGKVERCYPPQQKNNFHATAFSNVPALYRGKIINQRGLSESYAKRGRHKFRSNELLRHSNLSEFPDSESAESLRKKESAQHAFVLDRGAAPKLIIPQLELARVLFYASSYLSRASLMSSRLLTDFKVEVNTKEDYANIEVLQTSNFLPSAPYGNSYRINLRLGRKSRR